MAKEVTTARLTAESKSIVEKSLKGSNFSSKLQYIIEDYDKELKVAKEELKRVFTVEEIGYILNIVNSNFLYGDSKVLFLEGIQKIEDKELVKEIMKKFSKLNHFSIYTLTNWCMEYKSMVNNQDRKTTQLLIESFFR